MDTASFKFNRPSEANFKIARPVKAFVLEAISYFVVGEALTFYQHLDNHNLYLKNFAIFTIKIDAPGICPFVNHAR